MKIAIGLFKKDSGIELQAAYDNGNGKAAVIAINKQSLESLWKVISRSVSDTISDMFCSLAINRVNQMAAI